MRNVIWHRGKELFSVGKQLSSKMRATDQTQYPFLYQCQLGVFGYNSPCVSLSVCVDVAIAIERANRANEEGALRTYSTCTTNKYLCPPIVQYCMKMFSGCRIDRLKYSARLAFFVVIVVPLLLLPLFLRFFFGEKRIFVMFTNTP